MCHKQSRAPPSHMTIPIEKPSSAIHDQFTVHGSSLQRERCFRWTPNGVLTAHIPVSVVCQVQDCSMAVLPALYTYVREDWEACSWLGSCSSVVRVLVGNLGLISSDYYLFSLSYIQPGILEKLIIILYHIARQETIFMHKIIEIGHDYSLCSHTHNVTL